jgi:hypothetical protein
VYTFQGEADARHAVSVNWLDPLESDLRAAATGAWGQWPGPGETETAPVSLAWAAGLAAVLIDAAAGRAPRLRPLAWIAPMAYIAPLVVAGMALLAIWAGLVGARRRAARRAAEARARARARRNRVPLVSANVRGQSAQKPDIWREASEAESSEERVA